LPSAAVAPLGDDLGGRRQIDRATPQRFAGFLRRGVSRVAVRAERRDLLRQTLFQIADLVGAALGIGDDPDEDQWRRDTQNGRRDLVGQHPGERGPADLRLDVQQANNDPSGSKNRPRQDRSP
jgi:hypothetical protein